MTDEHNPKEYWSGKTDPTELTTDALRREIAALEKLIDTRIDYAEKLAKEKFEAIEERLEKANELRLEQKADTKDAVSAALEAQEKAISKSEVHTADQIKQLSGTVDTKVEGLEKSQAALDRRVTIVESVRVGATEERVEHRSVTAGQLAAIGVGVSLLVILVNMIVYLMGSGIN
jgi:hypothetical protein